MIHRSFLAGALALLAAGACAHEWYDAWCCNDRDCAPVPDGAVRAVKGGYRYRLCPGDHPGVTGECLSGFLRHSEARPSEDGRFHVCIYPSNTVRCVYVPIGGV